MSTLNHNFLIFPDIIRSFLFRSSGAQRRVESFAQRLNHLAEPEPIQAVECKIAGQISRSQPQRDRLAVCKLQDVVFEACVSDGRVGRKLAGCGIGMDCGSRNVGAIYVGEDADGVVCSPAETAREKGKEQGDAVYELQRGTGHIEFVAEPVDIKERGGEFVEDEGRCVEVYEWALSSRQ
jgi:hypothetical protein